MALLFSCMPVCHMHMWEEEEDIWFPGTAVDMAMNSHVVLKLEYGPSWEPSVPLGAESSILLYNCRILIKNDNYDSDDNG